jgi:hypothetical protein
MGNGKKEGALRFRSVTQGVTLGALRLMSGLTALKKRKAIGQKSKENDEC